MIIVANPKQFNIPYWFLNRQKDIKDGRTTQLVSSGLDMKLRDDFEHLKKIKYYENFHALLCVIIEFILLGC